MINFCELNKICISNIGSYRFFLKYFSRLKTDHECEIPTCKFLVACTRLYMSLCRSVGRSVRLSVGLSEITSLCFTFLGVLSLKEVRFELLPLPNYHTAPAHLHATDAAVYTALFLKCWIVILEFCILELIQGLGYHRLRVEFFISN
jgi:hypothetical protein